MEILADKKGENIVLLDVRGVSSVTDYYLIVTGTSAPHIRAMFESVQVILKQSGITCYKKAGDFDGGWMVLDYLDVIIHIFSQETREYYAIEELWGTARPPDLSQQ